MVSEVEGTQRAIAPESAAVQRARKKAQKEATIDPTALKTEEATRAIRSIQARQGHNPHEKVGTEIHREESADEIRTLRATLAAEYKSSEQAKIEGIGKSILGG